MTFFKVRQLHGYFLRSCALRARSTMQNDFRTLSHHTVYFCNAYSRSACKKITLCPLVQNINTSAIHFSVSFSHSFCTAVCSRAEGKVLQHKYEHFHLLPVRAPTLLCQSQRNKRMWEEEEILSGRSTIKLTVVDVLRNIREYVENVCSSCLR